MAKVESSTVAVTSINDQDGLVMQDENQLPSSVSRIEAYLHQNRTQSVDSDSNGEKVSVDSDSSGGKVTNDGIAVTSINNHDGVLIDYYTQYSGNGSTDGGWPAKDKWISFMDMCVQYPRPLIDYVILKNVQVQQ